MTYGPIDFIALEFKGNNFKGEIIPALVELIANKTIRVIDLVIVLKDEKGKVEVAELQQLTPDIIAVFDPLEKEVNGLIKEVDAAMVGRNMENNSTAAVMLFENLWAIKFKDAVLNASGRLLMQERIPGTVVDEALEDLAAADK
jgi:Family of unknown function (DUF6325)